ncbi:RHS repeat-associated core domain-containing protein [Agarivorans albus]|uniref:Rhs-family protein n=1 Tax=Agarivorans albus MKT 106 TaxID=1331007 RepID=R9PFN5_AGAAL|nr:RHS repeat-associated core domain-containing protein [Agarivorans albus]GAD00162.1 rhs-family protein [Agarivorans albus MKT 106]
MDGTQKEVVTGIDGFAYDFFTGKRNVGNKPAFSDAEKAAAFLANFAGAADSNGKGLRRLYRLVTTTPAGDPHQKLITALTNGEVWFQRQAEKAIPQHSPASRPSWSSSVPNEPKAPGGRSKTQQQGKNQNSSDDITQAVDHPDIQTCGDPIVMSSGEEVLQLDDVCLQGHRELVWQRTYRSSLSHQDVGLGLGWRSNFHYSLEQLQGEQAGWLFTDALGHQQHFPHVVVGAKSSQVKSGMVLQHQLENIVISSANGKTLQFSKQQEQWLLTKISDGVDTHYRLSYSVAPRLTQIEINHSQQLFLRYDLEGRLVELLSSKAETAQSYASYTYDEQGHLSTATNRLGQQEQYRYQQGLLIQRTRASGFSHYFSWDGSEQNARCIEQWGDNEHYHYRFEYELEQGLSRSFDSYGNCWTYWHNSQGQILKKVSPDGACWLFEYDELQRKISETDPNGATTRYHYNAHGQLDAELAPNQNLTRYSYNRLGFVTQVDYADGSSLKREYNSLGLLTTETDVQGVVTEYRYDAQSRLVSKTASNQPNQQFWWNEQGLLSAKQVGDALIRYSYNAIGECNGEVDGKGWVGQFKRDERGNIIEVLSYHQDAPEQCQRRAYSHDDAGRVTKVSDSLGRSTSYEYQGLSQPAKQINPDGSWLAFSYDKERNLTAITRSDEQVYQLEYDSCERISKTIGFDGREQHYQYNLAGQLTQVAENSERLIQLKRNSLGQVTEQRSTANGITLINDFTYDLQGKLSQANNAARKLRFSYFANGQLQENWQDNWQSIYQLNSQGLRSHTQLPDGNALTYRYDEQGRLSAIWFNQQPVISRSFNAAGEEVSRELSKRHQLHNHYDAQGRLLSQQWQLEQNEQAPSRIERHYRFDAGDQLLGVSDSELGDNNYSYDALSQLTKATSHNANNQQFELDSFANPKQADMLGDKLLGDEQCSYRYDRYGNQVLASQSKVRQQRAFNGLNQLVRLSQGRDNTVYHYDALGRRSCKLTAQGQTDYLWEGNQLIGEHSQGQYTWYVYEPNSHRPLVMIKQGQVYHYHLDHIGTPIRLTDEQGKIVWQAHYQAYGSIEQLSVKQIDNPLRFQGQYFDEESGLHYNFHRYYCPQQGRYIQQDPIELLGGLNLYQYTPSPTNWVDPLGLACKEGNKNIGRVRKPSKPYAPGESPLAKAGQAILDGLDALEIEALNEVLDDALDVAVEHGSQYPEGSFGRVATGIAYASLAAVMPTSALDVVPGGKAAKLRKAAKAVDTGGDAAQVTSKTRKASPPRDVSHRPTDSRSPDSFADEFSSLNHQKAAAGEYNAHALMKEKGYIPLGKTDGKYSPGKQGIDGIYQPPVEKRPPDFVIIEAKYGKSRLGKPKDGKQMSDDWVTDERLDNAGMTRKQQRKVLSSLRDGDGKVEKLLIRNKADGSLVVKKLDADAKIASSGLELNF